MSPPIWKIVGASVIGRSHLDSGTPCQDASSWVQSSNGFVAVVCDGAGSAAKSELGAKFASHRMVELLRETYLETPTPCAVENEESFRRLVAQHIERIRDELKSTDSSDKFNLADYHSTIVGVVYIASGGFIFHVGDGAAIALAGDPQVSVAVSSPNNGETVDTTFFFTADEWRSHLRITSVPPGASVFALMSDGVTPFCLKKDQMSIEDRFFIPVHNYLKRTELPPDVGQRELEALLSGDRANDVSTDDKTLIWISLS